MLATIEHAKRESHTPALVDYVIAAVDDATYDLVSIERRQTNRGEEHRSVQGAQGTLRRWERGKTLAFEHRVLSPCKLALSHAHETGRAIHQRVWGQSSGHTSGPESTRRARQGAQCWRRSGERRHAPLLARGLPGLWLLAPNPQTQTRTPNPGTRNPESETLIVGDRAERLDPHTHIHTVSEGRHHSYEQLAPPSPTPNAHPLTPPSLNPNPCRPQRLGFHLTGAASLGSPHPRRCRSVLQGGGSVFCCVVLPARARCNCLMDASGFTTTGRGSSLAGASTLNPKPRNP